MLLSSSYCLKATSKSFEQKFALQIEVSMSLISSSKLQNAWNPTNVIHALNYIFRLPNGALDQAVQLFPTGVAVRASV